MSTKLNNTGAEGMTLDDPQFTHDCSRCIFLGHREGYDVYYCVQDLPGDAWPTLIARYGNEPQHNHSGASFVTRGTFFKKSTTAHGVTVHQYPPIEMREPNEPAPWTNVVAAVLAEYVLKHGLIPKRA